jgi:prophage regulatory protein
VPCARRAGTQIDAAAHHDGHRRQNDAARSQGAMPSALQRHCRAASKNFLRLRAAPKYQVTRVANSARIIFGAIKNPCENNSDALTWLRSATQCATTSYEEKKMRIISFVELRSIKGIPFSRYHVDRLEKAGKFPRRVHVSEGHIGWLESEVDAFIASRVAERDVRAVA